MKKLLLIVGGAVIGLMVVRAFMLDPIEEMGWSMFWEAFFNGRMSSQDMGMVLQSATFMKLLIGTFVGGFVGFIVVVAKVARATEA
jgi:hypothetical protein